jgi:amicyanin
MSMGKKTGLWVRRGLLCLGLALAAVGVHAEEGKTAVGIDNFTFTPAALTVKKGTTVTWTNHDDIPHTVYGVGTTLRSKNLDTDQSYAFTFDKAGTFNYICGLHPHMKGKVIVTE